MHRNFFGEIKTKQKIPRNFIKNPRFGTEKCAKTGVSPGRMEG